MAKKKTKAPAHERAIEKTKREIATIEKTIDGLTTAYHKAHRAVMKRFDAKAKALEKLVMAKVEAESGWKVGDVFYHSASYSSRKDKVVVYEDVIRDFTVDNQLYLGPHGVVRVRAFDDGGGGLFIIKKLDEIHKTAELAAEEILGDMANLVHVAAKDKLQAISVIGRKHSRR